MPATVSDSEAGDNNTNANANTEAEPRQGFRPLATLGRLALCLVPKPMRCSTWSDFKLKVCVSLFLIVLVLFIGGLIVMIAWASHQRKCHHCICILLCV